MAAGLPPHRFAQPLHVPHGGCPNSLLYSRLNPRPEPLPWGWQGRGEHHRAARGVAPNLRRRQTWLPPGDLREIEDAADTITVHGAWYSESAQRMINR